MKPFRISRPAGFSPSTSCSELGYDRPVPAALSPGALGGDGNEPHPQRPAAALRQGRPKGAHGPILDAARGLDEGFRWVFDGLVATCPNAPATIKGSQPSGAAGIAVVNDLLTLPLAQRLELVQALWDSIAAEQNGPDLTDADRQVIDQRLESFLADGYPGVDADAALDSIEQSL